MLQVKGGTPGGGTLVMTLGESVECQCTTDSTCLTMEMLYGGGLCTILYLHSTVLKYSAQLNFRNKIATFPLSPKLAAVCTRKRINRPGD